MLKKTACLIAVLAVVFSLTVSAEEDFFVYGEDDIDLLCEALDMDDCDIVSYCEENNVTYLAVNTDNTKQIRRCEFADAFSEKIVDLSVLGDKEILELSESISGFSDVKGKIVNHNGLKFLKVELQTEDGGGEYTLTQYITVHKAKKTVLTFYTDSDADRDYIQSFFESQFPKETDYKPYVIIGLIVFAFAGAVVTALIIKEYHKGKNKE